MKIELTVKTQSKTIKQEFDSIKQAFDFMLALTGCQNLLQLQEHIYIHNYILTIKTNNNK